MSKNVPKLRFKKRDGDDYPEWVSEKISEIFTFYSTNSLSRDKLTDEETEMKNIHYGDIHTKFGSILDVNKMVLPSIKEDSIASLKNYTVAIDGDIFIADASEDYADIGKATEINNVDGVKIVGGLHVLHLRDEKNFYVNGIRGFLFNSPNIRDQIKIVAVGSKVLGLSKPSLGGLDISIIHKEEQLKIANFLSAIDSRITNQSSKLASLQELKKGVMQKIFSQEIRFKREDGGEYPDWENKRLSEIAEINPKTVSLPQYFRYIDLESVVRGSLIKEPQLLNQQKAPSRAQRLLEQGDIIFQTVRPYQSNNFLFSKEMDYPVVASTGYAQLRSLTNYNSFVFQMLHTTKFVNEVMLRCTGTGYPAINSSDLGDIEVEIPSYDEQQKIADFLSTLDSKISLESQILETLQTLKKALLQQMFV